MKKWLSFLMGMLMLIASSPTWAQASKDEAIAMANAALAHVQKVGKEQAFKDFTDLQNSAWHKKDLYVFVMNHAGECLAHGANEKLVGKVLTGIKDQNGKLFMSDMIGVAKAGKPGWVDYDWVHPQTKKQEGKTTYVLPVPGFTGFVGVGVYR